MATADLDKLYSIASSQCDALDDDFRAFRTSPKVFLSTIKAELSILWNADKTNISAPPTPSNRTKALSLCLHRFYMRHWLWGEMLETLTRMRELQLRTKFSITRVANACPPLYYHICMLRANTRNLKVTMKDNLLLSVATWQRYRSLVDISPPTDSGGDPVITLNARGHSRANETRDEVDIAMLEMLGSNADAGFRRLRRCLDEHKTRITELPPQLADKIQRYGAIVDFSVGIEDSCLGEAIDVLNAAVVNGPLFALHTLCQSMVFEVNEDRYADFLEDTPEFGNSAWPLRALQAQVVLWAIDYMAALRRDVLVDRDFQDMAWVHDTDGFGQFWEEVDTFLEGIAANEGPHSYRIVAALGLYVRPEEPLVMRVFSARLESASSAHGYLRTQAPVREKRKTRGDDREPAPHTELHVPARVRDLAADLNKPPVLNPISKYNYNLFHTLLFAPKPPPIDWDDFVKAMKEIMFRTEKGEGSALNFHPSDEQERRWGWKPISFHRPHKANTASKIGRYRIYTYRKRLREAYGWTEESFVCKRA